MKITIITLIAIVAMVFKSQAQVIPELSKYLSGKTEAEVVTVNVTNSKYTSFGKCSLRVIGNKLIGNYTQMFSDRSLFQGDKDNMGIELDLRNGQLTMIINSWGGVRETYNMVVQPNGKLLIATSNDRSVILSLSNIKGQLFD
jgi:hypothetical protein